MRLQTPPVSPWEKGSGKEVTSAKQTIRIHVVFTLMHIPQFIMFPQEKILFMFHLLQE
jgi:hypothetical protein